MFLSVADEFEKEARIQRVYGESPDWIRRVLQAYTRQEEYRWRILLRQAARGSRADIPLGTPISVRNAQQQPSAGVPSVATVTAPTAVSEISRPAAIQPAAPNQAVLPNTTGQTESTMDLGNILGSITDIARTYYGIRYMGMGAPSAVAPPSQAPVMAQPVGYQMADTYGVTPSPAFLGAAVPAIVGAGRSLASRLGQNIGAAAAGAGIALTAEEAMFLGSVASKTKCRRRRRRLATHSDIKDLAALKAVLGSGKAFDTWIATRKM